MTSCRDAALKLDTVRLHRSLLSLPPALVTLVCISTKVHQITKVQVTLMLEHNDTDHPKAKRCTETLNVTALKPGC